MGPEAVFVADLYETFWATGADYLTVSGPISLGGAALDFNTPLIFPGQMHTILRNEGPEPVHGIFAGLPEGTTFLRTQVAYRITYRGGTSGRDVVVRVLAATDTNLHTALTPVPFGTPVIITAGVRSYALGVATGAIELFDGLTSLGTRNIESTSGLATFTLYGLAPGTHVFTARYPGDGPFGPNTSSHQLIQGVDPAAVPTVTTLSAPLTTLPCGEPLLLSALVQVPGIIPPGAVTFYDGATVLGNVILDRTGKATLETVLPCGTHLLHASYPASYLFQGSTSNTLTATWSLIPTRTTLRATPSTAKEGAALALLATVDPDQGTAAGTVRFVDGSTVLGTATVLADQTALMNVATLAAGEHQITAVYEGTPRLAASTSTQVAVHIEAASRECPPPVIVVPPADATLSADGTASFSVVTGASPAESIQWFLGSWPDASHPVGNTATTKVENAGSATAVWVQVTNPCANVHASARLLPYVPPVVSTVTMLTAPVTALHSGDSLLLTALVQAPALMPAGTVTFHDGATSLGTVPLDGKGKAMLETVRPGGAHLLQATYDGAPGFQPSTSNTLTATWEMPVECSLPVIVVSPVDATLSAEGTASFSVVTGGSPGEAIQWFLGSWPEASHPVGNTATTKVENAGSATAVWVQVTNPCGTVHASARLLPYVAPVVSTITTLTAPTTALRSGDTLLLTALVQAPSLIPAGTVTFHDGATPLGTVTLDGAGKATLETVRPGGAHLLQATYDGVPGFRPSTSNTVSATWELLIVTRTTLHATPGAAKEGSPVTLVATVLPDRGAAEGTVRFVDGSRVLGIAPVLADGAALLELKTLPAGDHWITAFYEGNEQMMASSSASVSVHIEAERQDCLPLILVPPADAMTAANGTATLTVITNASPGESIEWFLGVYPDASHPLGTAATTKLENLRLATDVWVQVTNPCGSAHASVHLAPYVPPRQRATRH
jgi:hypothetical protein